VIVLTDEMDGVVSGIQIAGHRFVSELLHGPCLAWYYGSVGRLILQPRRWLARQVRHFTTAHGLSKGPFVAAHVRWGDKGTEIPLATVGQVVDSVQYLVTWLNCTRQVAPTKILVITETERAIAELRQWTGGADAKRGTAEGGGAAAAAAAGRGYELVYTHNDRDGLVSGAI
jgi:hypothetical protein